MNYIEDKYLRISKNEVQKKTRKKSLSTNRKMKYNVGHIDFCQGTVLEDEAQCVNVLNILF